MEKTADTAEPVDRTFLCIKSNYTANLDKNPDF